MKLKDYIYLHILPSLACMAMNLLSLSLRIQSIGEHRIEYLRKKERRIVYVLWHGRQFLVPWYMAKKNICIMSSTSRDGILQANILRKFGYDIIFGSSAKSPIRALFCCVKKIRAGYDFAFAVDGPTGPIHNAKPGALYLAKKANAYIVPLTFSAIPAITLNAWDKYLLPLPFAKTIMIFGKPFQPSPDLRKGILKKECLHIENYLNRITERADALVRYERPKK